MRTALIVWGGWEGHEPRQTSELLAAALVGQGFSVEMATSLDAYADEDRLRSLSLIVHNWWLGTITAQQLAPLLGAVRSGVGFGGVHGGMCDAFREQTEYQFMCGGKFVYHPEPRKYTVNIGPTPDPITAGIEDFEVESEQYYMHVDPANVVIATTVFPEYDNVTMPVAWKKKYGEGRVFHCSLGHSANVLAVPQVTAIVTRGLAWAAQ